MNYDFLNSGRQLIKFQASWCKPCKVMQPILLSALSELGVDYTLTEIDVEQHPKLAMAFQIKSYPTLLVLQDGVEKARYTGGATDKNAISAFVKAQVA